ncbi:hypothetical protein O181_059175 [Austropuccinia psidii MF-1]|uniref:Uncharacterized protein n=1 Tax=Austropuccinia psidii MF-1 TaxID=1389203 RepID=A0A9Q3HYI1_9BASI|nr:hypothetical protein [Austropuccinia psidii MF-1]
MALEPLMKRGGPEGLVLDRGPRTSWDTPRPKNKDKDLGVGDMEELAREAKDGRIWPEAIKGQGMDCDYGPRTIGSIGGLNGPKRSFRQGPP